jgi:hypothetical protein
VEGGISLSYSLKGAISLPIQLTFVTLYPAQLSQETFLNLINQAPGSA